MKSENAGDKRDRDLSRNYLIVPHRIDELVQMEKLVPFTINEANSARREVLQVSRAFAGKFHSWAKACEGRVRGGSESGPDPRY